MTTSLDPNRPLPRLVLLTGHSVPIGHVAFSHDGRTLASGSFDGMVILWDLPTNSMRARLRGNDRISDLAFSPDGAALAALDGDAIQLWETATGRWLRTFPGYKELLNRTAEVDSHQA
jgi:WD40 repeat protein